MAVHVDERALRGRTRLEDEARIVSIVSHGHAVYSPTIASRDLVDTLLKRCGEGAARVVTRRHSNRAVDTIDSDVHYVIVCRDGEGAGDIHARLRASGNGGLGSKTGASCINELVRIEIRDTEHIACALITSQRFDGDRRSLAGRTRQEDELTLILLILNLDPVTTLIFVQTELAVRG